MVDLVGIPIGEAARATSPVFRQTKSSKQYLEARTQKSAAFN